MGIDIFKGITVWLIILICWFKPNHFNLLGMFLVLSFITFIEETSLYLDLKYDQILNRLKENEDLVDSIKSMQNGGNSLTLEQFRVKHGLKE